MSEKIKVAFCCPWPGHTSADILKGKLKNSPNHDGVWDNIVGIDDIYEADWVWAIESMPRDLDHDRIDFSRVILTGREPPWMMALGDGWKYDDWHRYPTEYKFKHCYGNSYLVPGWSYSNTYKEMKEFKWLPRKKKICVVMSNKNFCPGHVARLRFVKDFCSKYPGVLDVYGVGMHLEGLGDHYKGVSAFGQGTEKFDWLSQYEYALAFENGELNGFFTEKITDVIMAYTVPIYWGAPDIAKYFPADSYYNLDIKDPTASDKLLAMIQEPVTQQQTTALTEARHRIMDLWGDWPTIKRVVETGHVLPAEMRRD